MTAVERDDADVGERGRTTLADSVVQKIAAQSATEVTHAAGTQRRLAGRSFGRSAVGAKAEVDGRRAALRLEVAVDYGVPAREVTRQVRAHVSDSVRRLCELDVERVEIVVSALPRRAEGDR